MFFIDLFEGYAVWFYGLFIYIDCNIKTVETLVLKEIVILPQIRMPWYHYGIKNFISLLCLCIVYSVILFIA